MNLPTRKLFSMPLTVLLCHSCAGGWGCLQAHRICYFIAKSSEILFEALGS